MAMSTQHEPIDDLHTDESETHPFVRSSTLSYGSTLGLSSMYPSFQNRNQSKTDVPELFHQSIPPSKGQTIRFQIVIWHMGPVDAVLGKIDMRFRATIFWNAPKPNLTEQTEEGYGLHGTAKKVWAMHGRQRAYERELNDIYPDSRLVYVPPLSILNAVDFEALGDAEVCLVDEESRLMRWSCLYKASLTQKDLYVGNFPHDVHELELRLGILKHRQEGKRWDHTIWKLDLANESDTQGSIQIPHGLLVDHVKVPGFHITSGLQFNLMPLKFGKNSANDQYLSVALRVQRDSGYYDRNIIPLLAALNVVGISTLALSPNRFGSRGQIIVATAVSVAFFVFFFKLFASPIHWLPKFAEVGLRMTLDSRLPVVGYQIKMQVVLNNFFFGLLFLVIGSSVNYLVFVSSNGTEPTICTYIDLCLALIEALHIVLSLAVYFELVRLPTGVTKAIYNSQQASVLLRKSTG